MAVILSLVHGAKAMNGASHLIPRNGTYYFQRRVPDPILNYLRGPTPEQEKSLPADVLAYFRAVGGRKAQPTHEKTFPSNGAASL